MAADPPPAPGEDLPARHASPSPPIPSPPLAILAETGSTRKIPDMLVNDPIPEHGGVRRVSDLGSEGLGDGQEDVAVEDSPLGTDGAGRKRKQSKNLLSLGQRKRRKSPISQSEGLGGGQDGVDGDNTIMSMDGACSKWTHDRNLAEAEQKRRKTLVTKNSKSPGQRVRSPMQVATSPGVNIITGSTILKRAVSMANSARRARIAGSAQLPPIQPPQVSPTLQNLSPNTRITNSHVSKRRRRKLISSIWREAMPIYNDRRLVQGRCNYCLQVFPASRNSGTSHILRHLKVCPEKTSMNEMVDKMGCPEGIDPNWKFDPDIARKKLIKLVVVNEMPFMLVEYKPFREFTAALNPWFQNMTRTTIKNYCMDAFKEHGNDLKDYFKNCGSRVSLTADMWTSNQKLGYLCITCHFISEDWELHKRIIRFSMLETPHNSINMFNVVLETIQEWNIEDKFFGFTLDNASVNTAMVNFLRGNLVGKGYLLSKGKLIHVRCATHIFNLIVQDGLREIKMLVNRIRYSVKYVKSSQARLEKFRELVCKVGVTRKYTPLSVDVTSRWNSTYLMLQTALPLRSVFQALKEQDTDYTMSPLNDEWELAEAVCKLLGVFYTATKLLSGSNDPTSHLYFHELWNIKKMLNTEETELDRKIMSNKATDQDIIIAQMVKQMQTKFNMYWKESYKSACIPVVLDPRFKYDFLEFYLGDFATEGEAGTWMDAVKKTMQQLFNDYNKEVSIPNTESDTQGADDEDDPLAEWDRYMRSKRKQSSNELDRYLKEDLHPRKMEIDILKWWQVNSSKYPVLSKMARDILAIPASTVPSESAFSTGGRVVSDYRSSLSCSTVEALICLQDWLKVAGPTDSEFC